MLRHYSKQFSSVVLLAICCTIANAGFARPVFVSLTDDQLPESIWNTFTAIRATTSEHQIHAPVDQQYALSLARAMYVLTGTREPGDLTSKASRLNDDEQTREFLGSAWSETVIAKKISTSDIERPLFNSLLAMTSGNAQFITAKESSVKKSLDENQYVGIGVQIQAQKHFVKITMPFPRGTAWEAGIKANDLITEVDGESMRDVPLDQVVDKLRGPKGSHVIVKVQSEDSGETRQYKMQRKVTPIDTVVGTVMKPDGTWEHSIQEDLPVAYIRFNLISGSTAAELKTVATRLQQDGFSAFIFDFRSIMDADLHHLSLLADVLLPEETLGYVHFRDRTDKLRTRADHIISEVPMVVLPPTTAPGPLFLLLERLQSTGRAKLIGSTCQSNMVCRQTFELPDGSGALANVPYAFCATALSVESDERSGLKSQGLNVSVSARLQGDFLATDEKGVFEMSLKFLAERLAHPR
jgi:C-terminal processing protease CtpA/Prc